VETFRNDKEIIGFIEDGIRAHEQVRSILARNMGTMMCYFEGVQWLTENWMSWTNTSEGRRYLNYNPDAGKLRVTLNRTTRYTLKAAAATWPENLYVSVAPPDRDYGVESLVDAQVFEDLGNVTVDHTGYLEARRMANYRRSIAGTWGVGFNRCAQRVVVKMEGEEEYETDAVRMKAFDFCPLRLTVDPGCQERELHKHEYVGYSQAWTAAKIKRVLGITLPEDKLRPISDIHALEYKIHEASGRRLFSDIARYSQTKGALVHEWYCKDDAGRFSRRYVAIDGTEGEKRVVVNGQSEYACDGLPFALLHGHPRADSMWSVGDVAMQKTDQDIVNLLESLNSRIVQKNAGYQWVVNRKLFARSVSEENIRERFNNGVGGVIITDPQTSDRNLQPPQLVATPPPQPVLLDWSARSQDQMREQVFRAEGNMGQTKSHVPDASFRAALEAADQVLGIRVSDDLTTDRRMIGLAAHTVAKDVERGDPSVLKTLTKRDGFTEEDLMSVVRVATTSRNFVIKLSEGSVRFRSYAAKKNDLAEGVNAQAVGPSDYRKTMADDLDSPIFSDDRYMIAEIRRSVAGLLRGQPWEPLSLGPVWGDWCVNELRKARVSREARANPAIAAGVDEAIAYQEQMVAQAVQALTPQPVGDSLGGPTTGSGMPPPETLGDLLAQLEQEPAPVA